MITIRTCKLLLLAAVAFFFTLVVFNNLTDFDSNYQFVRHVLMMDSTFPDNHGMWRAIRAPWVHITFYLGIIAWEIVNAILRLVGKRRALARVARLSSRLPRSQAGGRARSHLWNAAMVPRLPMHWRGVVFDVAVKALERSGRCFSHVRRGRLGADHPASPRRIADAINPQP